MKIKLRELTHSYFDAKCNGPCSKCPFNVGICTNDYWKYLDFSKFSDNFLDQEVDTYANKETLDKNIVVAVNTESVKEKTDIEYINTCYCENCNEMIKIDIPNYQNHLLDYKCPHCGHEGIARSFEVDVFGRRKKKKNDEK